MLRQFGVCFALVGQEVRAFQGLGKGKHAPVVLPQPFRGSFRLEECRLKWCVHDHGAEDDLSKDQAESLCERASCQSTYEAQQRGPRGKGTYNEARDGVPRCKVLGWL